MEEEFIIVSDQSGLALEPLQHSSSSLSKWSLILSDVSYSPRQRWHVVRCSDSTPHATIQNVHNKLNLFVSFSPREETSFNCTLKEDIDSPETHFLVDPLFADGRHCSIVSALYSSHTLSPFPNDSFNKGVSVRLSSISSTSSQSTWRFERITSSFNPQWYGPSLSAFPSLFSHRRVDSNGIRMHVVEGGDPNATTVVLCHGFPESWYSWRHQLVALVRHGYHVIVPDMRGYGRTSKPQPLDKYTIIHLVGDVVGLLDSFSIPSAVVIGHDWGAPVAWTCALLRPDRFHGVVGLSVPFMPRSTKRPEDSWPQTDTKVFYQKYYQQMGVPEKEMEVDLTSTFRKILYTWSGEIDEETAKGTMADKDNVGMVDIRGGALKSVVEPPTPSSLSHWLTSEDVQFFFNEYSRDGFMCALHWYRNINRNWELMFPFHDLKCRVPSMFMAGEKDLVLKFGKSALLVENLHMFLLKHWKTIIVPRCGHWIQQERPDEVSTAILEFLKTIPNPNGGEQKRSRM